jgi:SAM-dependent methyltransferase
MPDWCARHRHKIFRCIQFEQGQFCPRPAPTIMHVLTRARKFVGELLFKASLPPVRRWLRARRETDADIPPVGLVRFGSLRRLTPISRDWGDDRGGPIDRYYITGFLDRHRQDVRGRVLEIAEDVYAKWFGDDRVEHIDILQYREGEHPRATFVGDLADAPNLPADAFDCVILTQTLQLIYDLRGAVATVHRILKPGGVVLVTVPGITPVNRHDRESWGNHWCWSFTALSARRLFEERFSADRVTVETYGNVLAAASFLYGLGQRELTRRELDHRDPDYEMLIALRAQKESGA